MSKAMLSQIEQNKVNPTVAVMLKIAGAMGVLLTDLVDAGGAPSVMKIIPNADESYTFRSDAACNIRTLSPLNLEKAIEFYRISFEAGGQLLSEAHYPGTEEILHLSKGKLELVVGGETTLLAKGDSVHYRADLPHCLRNAGRGHAEAYMIVRYRQE